MRNRNKKMILGIVMFIIGYYITENSGELILKLIDINLDWTIKSLLMDLVMFAGTPLLILGIIVFLINFFKWVLE